MPFIPPMGMAPRFLHASTTPIWYASKCSTTILMTMHAYGEPTGASKKRAGTLQGKFTSSWTWGPW